MRRIPLVARLGDPLFPALSLDTRVWTSSLHHLVRGNASGQSDFGAKTGVNALKIGDVTIPSDAHGEIVRASRLRTPAA